MPTIASIQHITRRSGRRQLELDDGEAFSLDASLLVRHGIRVGMELDATTRAGLVAEDARLRAKSAAFDFLRMRNMSHKELSERLSRKGFEEDAVAYAVEVLEKLGYLSDEKVAQEWVESRQRSKPKGVTGLRRELRRKGIDHETIERTVATITVEDERGTALALGKKQMRRYRTLPLEVAQRRARDFLLRRGFPFDIVRGLMDELTAVWNAEHSGGSQKPEVRSRKAEGGRRKAVDGTPAYRTRKVSGS